MARAARQMVDVLVRVLAHSRIANARANAMALTAVLAQDPVVLEDIITAGGLAPPPPPPLPGTNRTSLVLPLVLSGHAASLTPGGEAPGSRPW